MSSISAPPWRNGKMPASPDLTLWGVGTSRTFRPHWAMYELGLPYKMKPIGPRTGDQDHRIHATESTSKGPPAAGRRLLHRRKCRDRRVPLANVFDARTLADSGSAARICRLARVVLLRRRRAGFHKPLRDASPPGRRARPNLWDCARGGRKSWRIFSRAVAPRRGRPLGWPAVPDGRQIYERRHPAHDLPGLGDRLRRRDLR